MGISQSPLPESLHRQLHPPKRPSSFTVGTRTCSVSALNISNTVCRHQPSVFTSSIRCFASNAIGGVRHSLEYCLDSRSRLYPSGQPVSTPRVLMKHSGFNSAPRQGEIPTIRPRRQGNLGSCLFTMLTGASLLTFPCYARPDPKWPSSRRNITACLAVQNLTGMTTAG